MTHPYDNPQMVPPERNPLVSNLLAPVPCELGFGVMQGPSTPENPGGQMIQFMVHTPSGTTVVYFPPSHAKQLAANLDRLASVAATGLILPDGN